MSDYSLSELMRRVERMVVVATVTARNGKKVKVAWADGVESGWLAMAQLGSKEQKFWIPQNAGDQVVVLSPGGDTTKGIVYPGPFSDDAPAGNFDGTFTGVGDVVASDISLVTHVHSGISPGPAKTGEPE
ncbi:phage baseplate assembly protein V [Ascidiaceihabitans sp.]|uniref:phage baseplate assembly protein V n=1 Tax=Ascidiaceihabitans sp. TaxID=1872644 RepID=UPI003299324E